jgi:ADP-heptose:LPS heptosyltransferase
VVALAGLQCSYRPLPPERWLSFIELASKSHEQILFLGSPQDREFAAQVEEISEIPFENLVGKLSLNEVIDCIRGAERFVSVDSGLVHVADFFKVPVTAYFMNQLERRWAPRAPGSTILTTLP